jgi:DNA-directed RNA polymerase specialized sigma24 family protein
MTNANKLAQPEVREQVTASILQLLASLPEAAKQIFIWKHYQGWPETQIASRLGCSPCEVEHTLEEISRTLYRRTKAILLNEPAAWEATGQPQEWYANCCA